MPVRSLPIRFFGVQMFFVWACAVLLAEAIGRIGFAASASSTGRVDFNFQIRPLLSDRCFKCHGPDEKQRKAKLRLDTAEGALAVRDASKGTRAIVPGQPDTSEVYLRIISHDPDDVMPPLKSGVSLSDSEKDLIRRWIEQGAEFKGHWSFLPVEPTLVPNVANPERVVNPIDTFVLARLEQEGLHLSDEASRETLIRRLTFDLTGLPPSLQEIDDFLADRSSNAYEHLIDRLLASPRYGERRAGEWLDLSRYADTYGYQADVERDLSPWRDWVIQAFNQNLSYDQFVTWQLAGDLLPNPSREQILATAFNRLHRQTNEGGSIEEEFRTEYAADRVHTAGTTFLGLSLECARCHDHKFDPINQRDYYRLFAFFNNIDESGLYSHFTTATPTPTLLLYPPGAEQRHQNLQKQIRETEERLQRLGTQQSERFEAWFNANAKKVEVPQPTAVYSFELVQTNLTPNVLNTNQQAVLVDAPVQAPGKDGSALQFSGDNSLVCKGAGGFGRTDSFSFNFWLKIAEKQDRAVVFHRSRAWTDSGSRGYELLLEDGKPSFALIHFWPGNAIKVRATETLATNRWVQLTVTYDGSSKARGIKLYADGSPLPVEMVRDHLFKEILHRKEWGDADANGIELTLAGRFRDSGFKGGVIDEFKVFDRCLTAAEIHLLAGMESDLTREEMFTHYLERVSGSYRQAQQELASLRVAENQLVNDIPEIMVMRELASRRPTFILKRGVYTAPTSPVEPGPPETLLRFSSDLPKNRLGLARWMVDRKNPLTARVEVNRVWRTFFGRGLVATAEEFGSQGQLPTNPQLLDFLAWQFMESGWDLKALYKLVAMSATYRQSSLCSAELAARDPDNRLLARGPKHRLQAEEIRDHALAMSGLLSTMIGGPSVRPYQPAGLWEESGTGKHYVQDKGEKLYRRSLYTFWRRTAPPPNMLSFDATSREVCTAKRETTSTPLQALILLNDPQLLEAARVLAERLLRQAESVEDLTERVFRLATGRKPSVREQSVLGQLHNEQLTRFSQDLESAKAFIKIGEMPVDTTLAVERVAAATVLASAVMNLDEFITER